MKSSSLLLSLSLARHPLLAVLLLVMMVGAAGSLAFGQGTSTQFTPTGVSGGGRLLGSAINPENPDELYIVCDMIGIYRSRDQGQNWQLLPNREIGSVTTTEIQFGSSGSTDPQRVYAIHRLQWGEEASEPRMSMDGGDTWDPLPTLPDPDDNAYYRIFADPTSTSADTQRLVIDNYRTLWFSRDGGQSYTAFFQHDGSSSDSVRLAGAYWLGDIIFVATNLGLFVSLDNGDSWFRDEGRDGLPNGAQITDFAGGIDPDTGLITIYAICVDDASFVEGWNDQRYVDENLNYLGLYSVTFTSVTSPWENRSPNTGEPFTRVDCSLSDSRFPWATTSTGSAVGIFKGSDNGANWEEAFRTADRGFNENENVTTGYQGDSGVLSFFWSVPTLSMDVVDFDSNTVIVTGDFPYVTRDGGATWNQNFVDPNTENPADSSVPERKEYEHNGLGVTTGHWVDWQTEDRILIASTDIGLQTSSDGGTSWTTDDTPTDPGGLSWANWYVVVNRPNSSRIYGAVAKINDVYEPERLTDDWFKYNGDILFSDDGGLSWDSFSDPGSDLPSDRVPGPCVWVAVDPANETHIYAAVAHPSSGGIYKSVDDGDTWRRLPVPTRTEGRPYEIAVIGPGELVVTYCARKTFFEEHTASSGVFYSNDGGETWEDRTGPDMEFFTREMDWIRGDNNTWFVAVQGTIVDDDPFDRETDGRGGVYRTTDKGLTWERIFANDFCQSVTYVDGATPLLYVTTSNGGLFVSENPNAGSPDVTNVAEFPFVRARRVFVDPFADVPGTIWVTTQGGGVWVGAPDSVPAVPVDSIVRFARNGDGCDFIVDVADSGGTVPALEGLTDLLTSPGGWNGISTTPTESSAPDGSTRYTWTLVDQEGLFQSEPRGYVRARRQRSDGSEEVTDVFGFDKQTFEPGTASWGVPWLKASLIEGTATTSGGNLVLDNDLPGDFDVNTSYYVEIVSGPSEGQRLEVDEGASSGTTLAIDLSSALNTQTGVPNLTGEAVIVRPHWTVDEVFNKNQFRATLDPSTADQFQVFDTANNVYVSYFLLDIGGQPGFAEDIWVQTGDAGFVDQGTAIVPPGRGFLIRTPGSAVTVTQCGLVRQNNFAQPFLAGSTLAGLGYPVAQSFASNNLLESDGFLASNAAPDADQVLLWLGDANPGDGGFNSYWLVIPPLSRWTEVSDAFLTDRTNELVFVPNRAFFLEARGERLNRVVQRPWVP